MAKHPLGDDSLKVGGVTARWTMQMIFLIKTSSMYVTIDDGARSYGKKRFKAKLYHKKLDVNSIDSFNSLCNMSHMIVRLGIALAYGQEPHGTALVGFVQMFLIILLRVINSL